MKQICKYKLSSGFTSIGMPIGANVVSAGEQNGQLVIWAIVDPENGEEPRTFVMLLTGERLVPRDRLAFIDTVQMDIGDVIHVFEKLK
jgi:hypothetical protein